MGSSVRLDERFGLPLDEWTDIGGGISIKPILSYDETKVVAFNIRHPATDRRDPSTNVTPGFCEGTATLAEYKPDSPHWQLVSARPLTLSPSIECATHRGTPDAMHGYIENGVWKRA